MHELLWRYGCGERAEGGAVLAVAGEGGDGVVATVVDGTAWLVGWGSVLLQVGACADGRWQVRRFVFGHQAQAAVRWMREV